MALPSAARADGECVVLLHGLARTSGSMQLLADKLVLAGFSVANIDYPSREQPIETLAPLAIGQGMHDCEQVGARLVKTTSVAPPNSAPAKSTLPLPVIRV